jgi:hypothetical protein
VLPLLKQAVAVLTITGSIVALLHMQRKGETVQRLVVWGSATVQTAHEPANFAAVYSTTAACCGAASP